ncbi:MAG: Na/Pi cotransporter family protein, partial [Alphaproteobacteria bacterium]|nr:Na/Pi cotransporter family protein [Alphaproteobacteria bacterium]
LHALIGPMNDQPVLAVLISALLTWLAHSSLGMVLLLMSFVAAKTIPVKLGLYMVMGANLGGAVAPVIMTLRDIPAGRRIPLGNLFIRAIGVLFALPLMNALVMPVMAHIHSSAAREIVNFHTLFNLALAVVFLPFIGPMTSLSEAVLPDKPREEDDSLPRYLDPTAVGTPAAALAGVSRETLRLSDIVQKMLQDTLEALRSNNPRLVQDICTKEEDVDSLYDSIKTYLARLDVEKFDEKENARYLQILTFSTNLEHIGDIIDKNLMELARKKIRHQDNFSRQGFAEISDLHSRVMESLQLAQNIFMTGDVKMARRLFEEKENLRSYEMHAAESHFRRLSEGVAETIATSSLHLDILRDLRRINSYLTLIAYPILENAHQLNTSLLKPHRVKKSKKKNASKTPKPAPDSPLPEKY